ncbi:Small glutamine-rich tetratricopeptide repeat-containing protein 2 [Thecaphora frezii]
MSSDQTHLAFAVASWLEQSGSSLPADKQAELQAAAKGVANAFGINTSDATQKQQYGQGPGLQAIFDIFLTTQKKMGGSSGASDMPAASASASTDKVVSAEDAAKAEELKAEGNKAMSSKDYGAAIEAYGKAIELNPKSPVYYSNRAAAFSQIGQHEQAIEDAKKASQIDPNFGKAYSRLGHALFSSGRFSEAVEAYQKGVEVDPSNDVLKRGLAASKERLASESGAGASSSSSSPSSRDAVSSPGAGGGFPDFGAGGMPDLASLMNNPMVAQMAQNLMSNPNGLAQLMNNPMLRQAAERFQNSGGMPDISAMMQDPAMRDLARNFMGGAGGAGNAGSQNNSNMYG